MAFKSLNTPATASTSDSQYSLTTSYQLDNSSNDVDLSLTFGPIGVSVLSKIKLDSTVLSAGAVGSLNMTIGKNNNLDGKFLSLYIVATVIAGIPLPAQVTVDLLLTGGVTPYKHQLSHTVATAGASVLFIVDIFLTT